jgi:hypothetical protein
MLCSSEGRHPRPRGSLGKKGQSGDYPSRRKTWTFTGKKSPGQTGELARAQRLQGCDRCHLQVTGIGASGWVTLRSFSDFCRAIFFGPTSCPKNALCEQRECRSSAPARIPESRDFSQFVTVSPLLGCGLIAPKTSMDITVSPINRSRSGNGKTNTPGNNN